MFQNALPQRRAPLLSPPTLLTAITAVGALLRWVDIGGKSLWLDEAFSVWLAGHPLPEMLSWTVRIDQHPPLYYLLLRLWTRLGDDAATVRALSAVVGTLTIPAIYLLGKRLMGRRTGLLAALLLALSPFHVRFAQEARMYTLLTLNASLALLALAHLLTDPRAAVVPVGSQMTAAIRRRRFVPLQEVTTDLAWVGYAVFTAATLWTHNAAVLFVGAVNLFVIGLAWFRRRKLGRAGQLQPPSLRNWAIAQFAAFVLWSPWLGPFVAQVQGVYRKFWLLAPTWRTVVQAAADLTNAFMPQQIGWACLIWALFGALALLGAWHLRRCSARLGLLLTLFLTPFLGEWLVSLRRPVFYDRTLIWASLPLYLLLATGLRALHHCPYVLAALAMVATVNGLSVREYYLHFQKEQWDEAAAYVAQRAEPGDLILFHATWVQIPFDFYHRAWDQRLEEHGIPVDLFAGGVLEPEMRASDLPRLETLVRDRGRVWLVYSHQWYTDPQGIVSSGLGERMLLRQRRRFYGLEVRLYVAPQGDSP